MTSVRYGYSNSVHAPEGGGVVVVEKLSTKRERERKVGVYQKRTHFGQRLKTFLKDSKSLSVET